MEGTYFLCCLHREVISEARFGAWSVESQFCTGLEHGSRGIIIVRSRCQETYAGWKTHRVCRSDLLLFFFQVVVCFATGPQTSKILERDCPKKLVVFPFVFNIAVQQPLRPLWSRLLLCDYEPSRSSTVLCFYVSTDVAASGIREICVGVPFS
jgi:hypothetical protein